MISLRILTDNKNKNANYFLLAIFLSLSFSFLFFQFSTKNAIAEVETECSCPSLDTNRFCATCGEKVKEELPDSCHYSPSQIKAACDNCTLVKTTAEEGECTWEWGWYWTWNYHGSLSSYWPFYYTYPYTLRLNRNTLRLKESTCGEGYGCWQPDCVDWPPPSQCVLGEFEEDITLRALPYPLPSLPTPPSVTRSATTPCVKYKTPCEYHDDGSLSGFCDGYSIPEYDFYGDYNWYSNYYGPAYWNFELLWGNWWGYNYYGYHGWSPYWYSYGWTSRYSDYFYYNVGGFIAFPWWGRYTDSPYPSYTSKFSLCMPYLIGGGRHYDAICKYEIPEITTPDPYVNSNCFISEGELCPSYKEKYLREYQDDLISQIDTLGSYKKLVNEEKDHLEKNIEMMEAKTIWLEEIVLRIESLIGDIEEEEESEGNPHLLILIKFKNLLNDEKDFKEKEKEIKENIIPLLENLDSDISYSQGHLNSLSSDTNKCYSDADDWKCRANCKQVCKVALTNLASHYIAKSSFYPPYITQNYSYIPDYLGNLVPQLIKEDTHPDLFICPPEGGRCTPDDNKLFCTGVFCWDINFIKEIFNLFSPSAHYFMKSSNPPYAWKDSYRSVYSSYYYHFGSFWYYLNPRPGENFSSAYGTNWYDIQCSWESGCTGVGGNDNPCPMDYLDGSIGQSEFALNRTEKCREPVQFTRIYEDVEHFRDNNFPCNTLLYLCEKYPNENFCEPYPFKKEDFERLCEEYPDEEIFCDAIEGSKQLACNQLINRWLTCIPYPSDAMNFTTLSGDAEELCNEYSEKKFCSYPEDFKQVCGKTLYSYNTTCNDYSFEDFYECGVDGFFKKRCKVDSNSIIKDAIEKNNPCFVCDYYSYDSFKKAYNAWRGTFGSNRSTISFLCVTRLNEFLERFYPGEPIADLCAQYPFDDLTTEQHNDIYESFKDYISRIPFIAGTFAEKSDRLAYESFCWFSYFENSCDAQPIIEDSEAKTTEKIIREVKKMESYCEFKEEKLKYLFYTNPTQFCNKYKEVSNKIEICKSSENYSYFKLKHNWLCPIE